MNPDPSCIHLIQEYVKNDQLKRTQQRKEDVHHINSALLDGVKTDELIQSCIAIAEEDIDSIMDALLNDVSENLFNIAGETRDNLNQSLYFEAIDACKKYRDKYINAFHTRYMDFLKTFSGNPSSTSQHEEVIELSDMSLSLVDNEALDDWIAVSDMATRSEMKYKEHLYGIERRLSLLYGINIDKENNPYGPASFCYVLKDVVNELNLEPRIAQVWYRIYKNILEDRLGHLYKKLNTHLVENNILPKLKFRVIQDNNPDSSSHGARDGRNQGQQSTSNNTDETCKQGHESSAHTSYGNPNTHGQNTQRNYPGIQSPSEDNISASNNSHGAQDVDNRQGSTASPPIDSHDLYGLIQYLQKLQPKSPMQESSDSGMPANLSGHDKTENTDSSLQPINEQSPLNSNELIYELTKISTGDSANIISGLVKEEVYSQILSILPTLVNSPVNSRIDSNTRNILQTTGNIYNSLLKDNLISGSVKHWLEKLEIPTLKMAMEDESLFFDKSHVARQFINKLSQLELYGEDGQISDNCSIKTKIDSFLENITNNAEISSQSFSDIIEEIDKMISLQQKSYIENIKDVLAECGSYQDKIDQEQSLNPSVQSEPVPNDTLAEWRKRVSRVMVGDWILFNADTPDPRKLRISWISKNKDRFVFTNIRGCKETILNADELAQHFRNKTAIVLNNVGEATFDRAQLSTLQNIHQNLIYNSSHDHLTGLVNSREFKNIITRILKSTTDGPVEHAICYINIEHLKTINKTCGTHAGDRLLIELTNLMKVTLRDRGIVARIGGNKVAIFMADHTPDDALDIIREQLEIMNAYAFSWEGNRYSMAFSMGLVNFDSSHSDVLQLLHDAETACHIAREKGPNKLHKSHVDDDALSKHKKIKEWATRIDEILDSGNLYLRYQPILPTKSDSKLGKHAEILLGLNDEDGKPISPEHYVLAAEKHGRMSKIDRWVINKVLQWMVSHNDKLDKIGKLAINLSGESLNDVSFASFITEQIKKANIPADRLCFEITETAGIDNLSDAVQFIEDIKLLGCSFSLDDFGTGLSSYAYLKSLPVDYLKIDGSFIKDIENNPSDIAVVKSITEIGHFMDKKIIAECVETKSTIKLLQDMGVDYVQGYAIKRPEKLAG